MQASYRVYEVFSFATDLKLIIEKETWEIKVAYNYACF